MAFLVMANRAYLYNTSIPVCDRARLEEAFVRDGSPYAEVADGADQIPVIWFFCFSQEDLIPATLSCGPEGRVVHQKILLPCVPVEKAVSNLVKARALLDAFVGDSALVEDYWKAAVDALRGFTLPLLVMDPTEVFLLNDPEEDARTFVAALGGGEAAFEAIRLLSFYEKNWPPYSYKEFMSGGVLDHVQRRRNSAALLGGFTSAPAPPINAAPVPVPVTPDFTLRSGPSIVVERAPASFSFNAAAMLASVQRASASQDSCEKKSEAKPRPWWKIW